jgi:nicotinamidase-related amidase
MRKPVQGNDTMNDHAKIQELLRIKDQAPVKFDPATSALVIVDVQRYFARAEYAFAQTVEKLVPGSTEGYFKRVQSHVLPNIKRLQKAFRSQHRPLIFLAAGCHLSDGSDAPEWLRDFDELALQLIGRRVCAQISDPSWQIDDSVAPLPGEIVVLKTSSGALSSTKLDQMFHNLGINSLVVCGLTTAVCVTQTAREFADRGFRVVVAKDACTELSEEMHDAALFTFGYVFGRVRATQEIEALLGGASAVRLSA